MEKGNCGDEEVAHICSKTCNVLACNQQVRRSLLLIQRPHTLNLMLLYVWSRDSKKYKSRNKKTPRYSSKENYINFLSRICKIILQSFYFRPHF